MLYSVWIRNKAPQNMYTLPSVRRYKIRQRLPEMYVISHVCDIKLVTVHYPHAGKDGYRSFIDEVSFSVCGGNYQRETYKGERRKIGSPHSLFFVSNYAEIMLTKVAELYRPLNCALYCRVVVRNFNDVVF